MSNDNQHIPSGYKPSPLGIIPEEWEVKRLGEIFTFKNGVNAGKDSYGEGVRFVNTMDVLNNEYITGKILRGRVAINEKTKNEFLVSFGDVLFNRTSETREEVGCSTVYLDNEDAVFGGFVIRAHDIDAIILNPRFKQYCFQPSYIRNQISALGNGAIRYNLGQEDLSKVNLLIPTKVEQEAIVSVISLWDTAIAKQTALIEQLTLRKRGLMQQLLTGKKRLKGFEGGSFHRLGNYISECNRRNNGCKRVLSVTNTRGFILQEEQFDKIVASNDTSNYKVVRRGEFAYNPSRVNVGSLAMLNEYDEGILSPMYIVFKANENIDKSYLLQCLQSWWFRGHIPAYTQGSVRDSLSFDGLCSMKFYIPKLQEQKAISAILEHADKEIEIQKQKLAAMQAQKKGLMQVLLTGKKRIK